MDRPDTGAAHERTRRLFATAIERRGGPKALAHELAMLGVDAAERTVASWREGRYFPRADIAILVWSLAGVLPADEHINGAAASSLLADQVADLAQRIERLEGRQRAWEWERRSAAGEELPPPPVPEGAVDLSVARLERTVRDLQDQIDRLRRQQA